MVSQTLPLLVERAEPPTRGVLGRLGVRENDGTRSLSFRTDSESDVP